MCFVKPFSYRFNNNNYIYSYKIKVGLAALQLFSKSVSGTIGLTIHLPAAMKHAKFQFGRHATFYLDLNKESIKN